MNKVKSLKAQDVIAALFVLAELVLLPLIQLTPGETSAFWSYAAIVLAGVMALVTIGRSRSDNLVRVGILFTLVADWFLVLDGRRLLEGVLAFCVVQGAYFSYLFIEEQGGGAVRRANVISRIAACGVLVVATFAVLEDSADALAVASVIYYANLVLNTVFAFLHGRRERIFAVGLALFCACDLCIGLEVLASSYLGTDAFDFFYSASLNLPWIFYQPSQTLIALSLHLRKRENHRA